MMEQEDPELTSPNKNIKTTTTYRATLVENDLNTSRTDGSFTTKVMPDHTESGRRGREAFLVATQPLSW